MQRGVEGLLLVRGDIPSGILQRQSYRPWGARQERQLFKPDSPNPAGTAVRIDAEAYGAGARATSAGSVPCKAWRRLSARSADDGSQCPAARCCSSKLQTRRGCAVVIPTGQTVYVPELLVPQPLWARAVAQIAALFPAQSYRICTPWNRSILRDAAHLEAGVEPDGISGIGAGLICPFSRKISCFFLAVTLFYLCIEAGKPGDPF